MRGCNFCYSIAWCIDERNGRLLDTLVVPSFLFCLCHTVKYDKGLQLHDEGNPCILVIKKM